MHRRTFLTGCSAAISMMAGSKLGFLALAPQGGPSHTLVVIFLRGGCDALHFLGPVGDRHYQDARGADLKVGDRQGLPLKNTLNSLDFCLHPAAAPLKELYDSGQLAFIHACGLMNATRSHFDAMDIMERGLVEKKPSTAGWLTRYLQGIETDGLLPAISVGGDMPVSFLGAAQAVSLSHIDDFQLKGDKRLWGILKELYLPDRNLPGQTALQTLQSLRILQQKMPKNASGEPVPYRPSTAYPQDNDLADVLKNLAHMIKLELGVRAAAIDFGGWDTHENQSYYFPERCATLAQALAAFYNDLSGHHARLSVVVMSEFGRRLKSNKSEGTDHGHGGLMMVLGGRVNGGRMYGKWTGLATEQLDQGADLAVSTDYRTVLCEVIRNQLTRQNPGYVFPGFESPGLPGLMREG